ncbi:MAG: hypothetical protein UZ21_OP11001000867 [Microgenomates bacterium OLB22]|nr:MAG: hypothetical protein UZ21_OP11001000867 [Microgenomates bacterium OLB22]
MIDENLEKALLWILLLIVGGSIGASIGGIGALIAAPFFDTSMRVGVVGGILVGSSIMMALGLILSPARERLMRDAQMIEAENAFEE